ncbi:DinB family protein [Flavitalea flava]
MPRHLFFLLCALFSQNAFSQSADKLFMDAAISKLQHAKAYTLKVAEAMPKSKYDFKPTVEEMNFAEQLLHLAENLDWLTSGYLLKGADTLKESDKKKQKKEEIIAVVTRAYDNALYALAHFNPEHLADTVSFFAGPMNKLQIINLINDHQTHHRAQMIVYLRLNGLKPPDYVGW